MSESADASETQETPEEILPEERPILVVDPDESFRTRVEGWEDEVGRPIRAIDPALLAEELPESLPDAAAVIVCWDLRGRPGLDVIEHVANLHPELPLVCADQRPSRERVETALRRGAKSVLARPFEAEEMVARLGPLPTGDDDDDAGDEDGAAAD